MYITQGLKRAVQINRNGIATIDGARQRTWHEFAARVAKLAGALQNLGMSQGVRVGLLAFNSDRYLECFFGVPWGGGIIMPLNVRLAPPELIYMLNDAEAEILVVDDSFKSLLPTLRAQAATVKHWIVASDSAAEENALGYEEIIAAAQPAPDAGRGGNDVAGIFYTGGTTGLPKGVMLTHDNLVSNALAWMVNVYRGEPWVYLHAAPMFHIADTQAHTAVTMQAGTHVFIPKFIPEEMLKTIQAHRVTYSCLVPTLVNMLANHPSATQYDASSLRGMTYGGSPMPSAIAAKARGVFPGCELTQGYGQTETAPNISMLSHKYHVTDGPFAGKIQSAGLPVHTVEVRIADSDDREVPRGTIGEIIVRGPNVMAGYWNKPKETAAVLRNGWMHTGDVGYMDEDGFVFIVDRLKDMIITGGENVYSPEVENAIYQLPAVAMCAVIGIPSEQWGEAVHAIIALKEGQTVTEEEILAHCRKLIAGYKCPKSIEFRQAPMPMSGAGKILKRDLREPYWQGKTRQVN